MSLSEITLQSIPETEKGIQTGFALVAGQNNATKPVALKGYGNPAILLANQNLQFQLNQVMEKVKHENDRKRVR